MRSKTIDMSWLAQGGALIELQPRLAAYVPTLWLKRAPNAVEGAIYGEDMSGEVPGLPGPWVAGDLDGPDDFADRCSDLLI